MLTSAKNGNDPKHVEAGKLLSHQLHEAREKKGQVLCPSCRLVFDATHVMKCPGCRTFISKAFKELCPTLFSEPSNKTGLSAASSGVKSAPPRASAVKKRTSQRKARRRTAFSSQKTRKKMELELDFFTQGYMEYPG